MGVFYKRKPRWPGRRGCKWNVTAGLLVTVLAVALVIRSLSERTP